MTVLTFKKGELPLYYGGKFLYRTDAENYTDYLSMKEANKIAFSKKYHQPEYISLLKNKLAFSFYCEDWGIPIPRLVSYNMSSTFFYNGKNIQIADKESLISFYRHVFKEEQIKSLFIKPIAEHGGTGCQLLTHKNMDAVVEQFGDKLITGGFIHQERVEQHPDINAIYSHSLNTMRFETFIDEKGKVHLLCCYIRFGSGGNFVDNNSSGGFYVGVDLYTGRLLGSGRQKMKSGKGGRLFFNHPDTHFPLKDFKIPYFEEAVNLVRQCVKIIPSRYIGWDVAITGHGPMLIEGNGHSAIKTADIASGGYLKNPIVQEMLKEA